MPITILETILYFWLPGGGAPPVSGKQQDDNPAIIPRIILHNSVLVQFISIDIYFSPTL